MSLIKIDAWFVISIFGFLFIAEPMLMGKPRQKKSEVYSAADWFCTLTGLAIFLPLCGRVLGWW